MKAGYFRQYNLHGSIAKNLEKMFKAQLTFGEIAEIEDSINNISKEEYEKLIIDFFKLAREVNYPINESKAKRFVMGMINKLGKGIKNLKFRKKKNVIIAEGDSWFEHFFIKDIIDHLIRLVKLPIYSLAYGGDWMGNYLENPKYLKELKKYKASVFLLSGGGNDLVGKVKEGNLKRGRLYFLVKDRLEVDVSLTENDKTLMATYIEEFGSDIAKKLVTGRKFLNGKFWTSLNVLTFQYLLVIRSIENEKDLNEMKIIVQGYDFAIPDNKKGCNIFRRFLGHGKWLFTPLKEKGIVDAFEQESVVATMMFEFNQMLDELSKKKTNLYFIDSRGVAGRDDWRDELHLKSDVYKKIAMTYKKCINSSDKTKKRYRVIDDL